MQTRQKRVTVSAGSEHGLALWGEFTSNSADGKFHLAEYLQRLVDKLAVSLTIYVAGILLTGSYRNIETCSVSCFFPIYVSPE